MLAITLGGVQYAWNSATIIAMFCAAGFGFCLFVFNELFWAHMPLLEVRLFLQPTFARGSLGYFFFGWTLAVMPVFLSVYFQEFETFSPIIAGLFNVPLLLSEAFAGLLVGKYVSATGKNTLFPPGGMLVFALGCGGVAMLITYTSSAYLLFPAMIVSGCGLGMVIATLLVAIQNSVERASMARATAAINFTNRFGASIGLAVCNSVYTSFAPFVNHGVKYALLTTCVPAVLGIVVLARLPKIQLQSGAPAAASSNTQTTASAQPLLERD